jgi:hypothetical protein
MHFRIFLCCLAVVALVSLTATVCHAEVLTFDFSTDPAADWDLYDLRDDGSPQYVDGGWDIWESEKPYLELIQGGTSNAMGTAWINRPLQSDRFDVEFKFQPTSPSNKLNGFTFGWVDAEGSNYGNIGGTLGAWAGPNSQKNDGHTGYFVETDYDDKQTYDPTGPHFGVMESGPNPGDAAAVGGTHGFVAGEFSNTEWYGMRIQGRPLNIDGSRTINMWVDTDEDGDPWDYDLSFTWDIPDYTVEDYRYYGFTSATTPGKDGSFRIDDVTLHATPEPTTLVLLPLGMAGFALIRRRMGEDQ